jgi:hypothetical protein
MQYQHEVGSPGLILRPLQPGDLGWVVQRHGLRYATEFGWDVTFEGLVARIVADFAERHDDQRQAAWIAEIDGERVGCVFCAALRRCPLRNYACCSSNRRHAVRGWELGWSMSASGSPPDLVTPGSCCGLKMCNWTLEGSISGPDSNSMATSPTTVSAVTSSANTGRETFTLRDRPRDDMSLRLLSGYAITRAIRVRSESLPEGARGNA